jgi:hypothetical protein
MSVIDLTYLIETANRPVDDTLEADQFRCVTCGRVTWEHEQDQDGECPDCAETTTRLDQDDLAALLTAPPILVAGIPRTGKRYAARMAVLAALDHTANLTVAAGERVAS